MSFLITLRSIKDSNPQSSVYTRPWQLPTNVKFQILKGERVKKNNSPDSANRVIVQCGEGFNLLIYISGKWGKLTEQDFTKMNEDLNGGLKLFLVSRGGVSLEGVVLEIMSTEEAAGIPLFSGKISIYMF